MPYPFLSDQWIEKAHAIRAEYRAHAPGVDHQVRMNLVVTEMPFGDGDVEAHLDTTAGELDIDRGHVADADLTVTVDYETAKAILVERNPQSGMQAFMAGKIRVEGDMAPLLAIQSVPPDRDAEAMADRLREITE